jgi:serine phosphatase RsbU (regulator of sigma subunit)/anti-sigma regulatory factor (Ser/Thr protein kinase)
MIALVCLYPNQLGVTESMSATTTIVTNIIETNVIFEVISAVIISALAVPIFHRAFGQTERGTASPIRKTFQKWLLLFITLTFFVMLFFVYYIQTQQDLDNAEQMMVQKCQDIAAVPSEQLDDTRLNIGDSGYVQIIKDGTVQFDGSGKAVGESIADMDIDLSAQETDQIFHVDIDSKPYDCLIKQAGDYTIVAYMSHNDIYKQRNQQTALLLVGLLLLASLMYANISGLVQGNVVQKIQDINDSLIEIRKGKLEEKVTVNSNIEFAELSEGINATVTALKETMEKVAEKMNQEMEFAREIQHSALPSAENVAPKMHEYEILGTMDAAREVGGDFYDYFLVGENKLAFVIADVSGKGVPAALFMMTAKTLIKNFVLNGKSPAKALELANMQLCENNEAGMFVTAWLGILDYSTGELEFANAGHNPPLLKKGNESFVYMDHKTYKRSIMLGMREGIRYQNNKITFTRGDILYLYTDGVTEANNVAGELYGEQRLLNCIQNNYEKSPENLIQTMREDIDGFAGEAEQFDDITMVVLKMHAEWKTMAVEASFDNTSILAAFVEENLPKEAGAKISHQIAIAFDEIYSNVVKYSKATQFELRLGILDDMIYLVFTDNGIPYNPMESPEPDIEAPIEERRIGGLGLFLVKRTMDYTEHQYFDDKNRFTIGKKFQ